MSNTFPLYAFIAGVVIAQVLKPLILCLFGHQFDYKLMFASGGYPSSHSAGAVSLALACGLKDNFDSTSFALATALACFICYDAANVRYYSGRNIELTKHIVEDLRKHGLNLIDPIYDEKIKQVLGHNWSEVLSGILIGLLTSWSLYLILN